MCVYVCVSVCECVCVLIINKRDLKWKDKQILQNTEENKQINCVGTIIMWHNYYVAEQLLSINYH